jgi:transposase
MFAALPGAGPVHAARLTAALGSARSRWTNPDELLRFSGIAPVIERSGKQFRIRWRYFCPKFRARLFMSLPRNRSRTPSGLALTA